MPKARVADEIVPLGEENLGPYLYLSHGQGGHFSFACSRKLVTYCTRKEYEAKRGTIAPRRRVVCGPAVYCHDSAELDVLVGIAARATARIEQIIRQKEDIRTP